MVSCKSCCHRNVLFGILVAAGVIFLTVGLTVNWVVSKMVSTEVAKGLRVEAPSGDSYKQFVAPYSDESIPVYISYYLFNVKNSFEVIQDKAKPSLQEMGPYVYREFAEKFRVSWNEELTTVSYYIKRYYIFDEEASHPYKESDNITTLNIPLLGMLYQIEKGLIQLPSIVHKIEDALHTLEEKFTPLKWLVDTVIKLGKGPFMEAVQTIEKDLLDADMYVQLTVKEVGG
eukprot:Colp12_sorted_trinity150504_noHs@2733